MDYSETLDYLYSRLPMYQRQGKSAYKADLNNTIALLEALDNPQNKFKSIHIAGTNGKGTSAHAIAAILQTAGYKTGLYTSPHLKEFTERIRIDADEISKKWVVEFVEVLTPVIEAINPSFFEVTVAMAFQYFADTEVDIAVIETGLGGRLDSTNVITPEVCLITNIGLDHTDLLGDTIEKIAAEKAGIIKKNVPVVIGDMHANALAVMKKVADKEGSPLIETQPVWVEHEIPYFTRNTAGIMGVIGELRKQGWSISKDAELEGLRNFTSITNLKGRYQRLGKAPIVIADVSHNRDGLFILIDYIKSQTFNKLHVVFGTVKDKNLRPIFDILPREGCYYFTQSAVPRSLAAEDLRQQAANYGIEGEAYANVNEAMKAALFLANSEDIVLVTGSTFVVAEIDNL